MARPFPVTPRLFPARNLAVLSAPLLALTACGGLGLAPLGLGAELDSGFAETITPVQVPLSGRTYDVSLHEIEVVEPAGLGPVVQAAAEGTILFHVVDEDLDRLSVVMTMGDIRGDQVDCNPIYDLPEADWTTNPQLNIRNGRTQIEIAGQPLNLRELSIETTITPDAAAWSSLRLRTLIDTRELLGGSVSEDSDVCALVEGMDGECIACPDGELACAVLELAFEATESDVDFDLDADDC